MKVYKIRSDYDCLIKHEGGECFLDINSQLVFDRPEKILVYPLSQLNKNSFPFIINLDSCEDSRFFRCFKLKKYDFIYISSMPYVQNEIIESIAVGEKECKIHITEDFVAFEMENQKKTIPLTRYFDDYSIKVIKNFVFLHLVSENEILWALHLENKTLKQFVGKKIELFDNHLTVVKEVNDIANHVIYQTFEIKDDDIVVKQDSLKYSFEEPTLVSNPAVIPIAFLEAIKIEDFNLAKTYLEKNLAESTSENHLKNYFKSITKIIPLEENSIGIITDNNLRIFSFEIQNSKITEINEVEP